MRRIKTVLLLHPLAISMGVIAVSLSFVRNAEMVLSPEMIQTLAYSLMLLTTFVFIGLSKKSLASVGLFRRCMGYQLIMGGLIAAAFLIVGGILTGWRFTPRVDSLSFLLSQALVVFTEELLFRGYVLAVLRDVVKTSGQAVALSALVFGLWHYPISHYLGLVLITFFTGAVYGALRTVFEKTDKEIGILSLSMAHWLMNVIL